MICLFQPKGTRTGVRTPSSRRARRDSSESFLQSHHSYVLNSAMRTHLDPLPTYPRTYRQRPRIDNRSDRIILRSQKIYTAQPQPTLTLPFTFIFGNFTTSSGNVETESRKYSVNSLPLYKDIPRCWLTHCSIGKLTLSRILSWRE